MSYTQFVATATLTICDGFNLESYLDAISERSVKEKNFLFEEYGEDNGKVDIDLSAYVCQNGDNVLIECDTEEYNSDSQVWDWLISQFVPVMNSRFVEIKSATIDSRSGVDVSVAYLGKDNQYISTDDLIKNYISSVSL